MHAYLRHPTRLAPHLFIVLGAGMAAGCEPTDGGARGAPAPTDSSPVRGPTAASAPTSASADSTDWAAVDQALGRRGEMQPGGVYKFSMPRADLQVTAAGVRIKPALALGSWLAFKPKGSGAVAMGDLVLTEQEYNRVIARLQQGGVGQTAVHKHLPKESPAIWWTHVHGEGDPVKIAQTVRAALALTATPTQSAPARENPSGGSAKAIELDTAAINRVLGRGGKVSSGVYQVSVARAETIKASGIEVPASMGTATALNFQPTGGGKAAINGDFVMTADEVQPVIAALEANGIQVVAVHNHLLDEEPRLFFMHFWANDEAVKLARGLKAGLDRINSAPATSSKGGTTSSTERWDFDDVAVGTLPSGWKAEQTNPSGQGAQWSVRQDPRAPSGSQVLALTNPRGASGGTFNLAWTDGVSLQDGRVEVKVKSGTGREDQGGGPVWRVQDKDNYYIARWNPLEDNFRLYYVRDGRRRQLKSATVDLPAEAWHTVAVDHRGNRITAYLNGRRMFETTDGTFSQAGGIGVWTKADAASSFDEVVVNGSPGT